MSLSKARVNRISTFVPACAVPVGVLAVTAPARHALQAPTRAEATAQTTAAFGGGE